MLRSHIGACWNIMSVYMDMHPIIYQPIKIFQLMALAS